MSLLQNNRQTGMVSACYDVVFLMYSIPPLLLVGDVDTHSKSQIIKQIRDLAAPQHVAFPTPFNTPLIIVLSTSIDAHVQEQCIEGGAHALIDISGAQLISVLPELLDVLSGVNGDDAFVVVDSNSIITQQQRQQPAKGQLSINANRGDDNEVLMEAVY